MTLTSSQQAQRARQGNVILCSSSLRPATLADFSGQRNVLFIHGYLANASYLRNLMDQFEGAGFNAFAFEYACLDGIDNAAKSLKQLLALFELNGAELGKFVLVAHSMGGLVARAFISLEGGAKYVRKLITLGTPHNGTLRNAKTLHVMADWAESVFEINPLGYSLDTLSAKQLMGKDGPEPLLHRLRSALPPADHIDFLSISGGYPHLEFGKNTARNFVANAWLQKQLRKPNDGLVEESSSNLAQAEFSECMPNGTHYRTYPEYHKTNHSNLIYNQSLALLAVSHSELV